MKFPISELDLDMYYNQVYSMLSDENCTIFLDTNILARFFAFHSSARTELHNYLQSFVDRKRLKVPVWVVNEYSKHFVRQKTNQYYETVNKISTIISEFGHFSKFVKMFIEPSDLAKYGYLNESSFRDDLDSINAKLEQFSKVKGTNADYVIRIHNQIEKLLSDCVLKTNVFKLVEQVSPGGENRYLHEIPPGYEDGGKKENSFGDLISWKEILGYCAESSIKKAIIVTNDEKRDWMYAPYKIKVNGRSTFNSRPLFKIADTRLVYEFELATESDKLFIINLSTLVQTVSSNGDNSLSKVGEALQLEVMSKKTDKKDNENTNLKVNTSESVSNQEEELVLVAEPQIEIQIESTSDIYIPQALADSVYVAFTHAIIESIVGELKTSNWYHQNPAIEKLLLTKVNQFEKNDLFVLGRNIYQAACGGAFEAVNLIERLSKGAEIFPINDVNHIVSGISYEVYFDSHNQFRKGDFKVTFVNFVFTMLSLEKYSQSREYITKALNPYSNFLLIIPTEKLKEINFQIKVKKLKVESLFGDMHEIVSINYEGEELLKDTKVTQYQSYLSKHEIIKLIMRTFAIPDELIRIHSDFQMETNSYHIPANKIVWRGRLPDDHLVEGEIPF